MNVLVDTSVWIRFLMKRWTGVSDLKVCDMFLDDLERQVCLDPRWSEAVAQDAETRLDSTSASLSDAQCS